jgi:hypothetical protein
MSALRRLLAISLVAAGGGSSPREVDAVDRWLSCVAARGHSFDVDGQCSHCGARVDGKSVADLVVDARIRREGN